MGSNWGRSWNQVKKWGYIRRKQIARWLYFSRMQLFVLLIKKYFWLLQYAADYHPGPVAPPRTDGAPLSTMFSSSLQYSFKNIINVDNESGLLSILIDCLRKQRLVEAKTFYSHTRTKIKGTSYAHKTKLWGIEIIQRFHFLLLFFNCILSKSISVKFLELIPSARTPNTYSGKRNLLKGSSFSPVVIDQIQTWDGWVGSMNATSEPCHPRNGFYYNESSAGWACRVQDRTTVQSDPDLSPIHWP